MANNEFEKFRLDILAKGLAIAAIASITAFVLGQRFFAIGYVIGFLISVSSFANLYTSIKRIAQGEVKKIKLYLALKFLTTYAVLSFALIVSFLKDTSMFLGVVFGFMSIKIIIFITNVRSRTS